MILTNHHKTIFFYNQSNSAINVIFLEYTVKRFYNQFFLIKKDL